MKKINRQEFMEQAFKWAVSKTLSVLDGTALGKALESAGDDSKQNSKLRPPGASLDDKQFLALCTGCDACMAACPVNVILIDDLQRRDPYIDTTVNPCIQCPGYPCIASCPTGALDYDNPKKINHRASEITEKIRGKES